MRRLVRLIICVVSVLLPAFKATAQVDAEQVLSIGINVLSMDDYMLSIHYFNEAIKAKPYLSEPYYYRALAKLNLDDYRGAEEDCTLAIQRNSYKTEAYKLRGFARQYLGKDSLAIEDYDIGLAYNPTDKYFLYYKGVAQTEAERYSSADSTFSTLLRAFPNFDEGFTARGRLNLLRGDTIAALADLDKAIDLSRTQLNAYLMRAEVATRQAQWEKALADMDAAVKLRPEMGDLYLNRAYIRYNADDFFGAMSDYNYLIELEPYNSGALFNRALLRYEVKDLRRSEDDLTRVLKIDPANFHALYNRGLVRLELENYRAALSDFQQIREKYPRFYPVYYALAEAEQKLGNLRAAHQYMNSAQQLVKGYVTNPEKNPLDRPKIAAATNTASSSFAGSEDEDDNEVMKKFNQLVTVSATSASTSLSYNERIKGRVQDRDVNVEPEPAYVISFYSNEASLRPLSNYFRELDDLNQHGYIPQRLYLSPAVNVTNQETIDRLFAIARYYDEVAKESPRAIDLIALGVAQTMLKNYPAAIEALDRAISDNSESSVAYMARAGARMGKYRQENKAADLPGIISDLNQALALNPRLLYAWFDKGNVYYLAGDYTSALESYNRALAIDPDFGDALYNRGLTYLHVGNKRQAFADLRKAGELGVIPSYNLLKRMK